MHFCEEISTPEKPINLNVIPKLHALFVHIKQFIKDKKETHNVEFGLGFYSEQSFESIHHVVNVKWAGGGFKRPMNHPDYSQNLENCVVTISSENVG